MKLLRRNTVTFGYRAYLGEIETTPDGMHSGDWHPQYDTPVTYRGNISPATGTAEPDMFGLDVRYSHVLLMDDMSADIGEDGLIEWQGSQYDVVAVSRSFNVISAALMKRTANHATAGD